MKLVVNGCAGRMGRTLVRLISENNNVSLAGGLEPAGSQLIGEDIGTLAGLAPIGLGVSDDPLATLKDADGVIDFTAPDSTVALSATAAQARIVHIIGTTGFTPEQEERITAAARHACIVKSGNMSLGVNLLSGLVKKAAAALGDDWDIEVVEMHHRHKVDAPSGTALMLGESAAQGRGVSLDDKIDSGRHGITGARRSGDIGFATLRGGSVIGDHQVILAGESERLVLGHIAENRDIFARGALRAALWAQGRDPGLYHMTDVLGL
ncbi:MAG: 4-hydroxy-tetrahydrodipicolinate reductase [Parvibaculales bacterium]